MLERSDLGAFTGGLEAGVVLRAQVAARHSGIATLRVGKQQLHVPMARCGRGQYPLPIRIHARDVAHRDRAAARSSASATCSTARILRSSPERTVNVELLLDVDGEHLRARITRDALEELALAAGQQVFALIKSVALESSLGWQ